jgi:hypothetical protein
MFCKIVYPGSVPVRTLGGAHCSSSRLISR